MEGEIVTTNPTVGFNIEKVLGICNISGFNRLAMIDKLLELTVMNRIALTLQ